MNPVEDLVDQVIGTFESRRRTHWSVTGQPLTVADPKLKRWHELVERRLETLRSATVDRASLLERVRARFRGTEWTADFAGVADELQKMARDDLRQYLMENGVPGESAAKIVEGYSIGAVLHKS
jgi:hypothetical protein